MSSKMATPYKTLFKLYPFPESKKWYLLFKGISWSHDLLAKTLPAQIALKSLLNHPKDIRKTVKQASETLSQDIVEFPIHLPWHLC